MKLELKSIEVLVGMSEETHCYSASLWVDGRRVGKVGNAGHGGADTQDVDPGLLAGINAWLANNEPPAFEIDGVDHPCDLEIWCSQQVNTHLVGRELAAKLRKAVLYSHGNGLWEVPKKGRTDQQIADAIRKKHGADTKVLNLMDRDAAVDAFRQAVSD